MDSDIGTKRRVLVVDDEYSISSTLACIFIRAGYDARAVYSAEQGLEILVDWPPHLAVIDICLPGMNGIEFAIHVMAHCSDCRLLLFSGQPESADLLERAAINGHSWEVVAKPVHPAILLERAAQLLSSAG